MNGVVPFKKIIQVIDDHDKSSKKIIQVIDDHDLVWKPMMLGIPRSKKPSYEQ